MFFNIMHSLYCILCRCKKKKRFYNYHKHKSSHLLVQKYMNPDKQQFLRNTPDAIL